MHYTTFLPHACINDVLKGINVLAHTAVAAMHENPHRPQHAGLHVAEMTMDVRPIYARNAKRRLFGIFRDLPHPGAPCGDRLLVIGIPYLPDCQKECCGRCRTCLPVEVRIDPRFPLDPVETRWKFGQIFGVDESSIVNTHPSWLTRENDEELLVCRSAEPSAPPQQCPRETGAPPCDSTLKLQAALEGLHNLHDNRHLKPQWLAWYREEHGQDPCDIDGSFRHAVNTCLRRIERKRQESKKASQ
jgi:hypothetical protein